MFFSTAKQGSSFDQGGYDIGFIGWGYTSPVPDFRGNFDGRPAYLAPSGSNYALYNSTELNGVFDRLYATADPAVQKQLTDKAQEIVFNDKPYNYIYEPTDAIPINSKWTIWGTTGRTLHIAKKIPGRGTLVGRQSVDLRRLATSSQTTT